MLLLPYFSTGDLCNLFSNCRNVFIAVVPPCWSACVRFWRGRQSGDAKYWKFLYVVFVCSQMDAGQGNTSPWLGSNVMSPWSIRCCTKVSFKNKLSFSRFYIFLNFTFIINGPFREIKVWVFTVLASWQVVWKRDGQRIFRDQASYTVDNKTGTKGKVVPVHEMKARWGE